jgi:hypothetical protein
VNSTNLNVCHNHRIPQHKVFQDLTGRQKISLDWSFGFTLRLIVNDEGELLNFVLALGNNNDCTPVLKLLQQLFGKVFVDKGYICHKSAKQLPETVGVHLITKFKQNRKIA